MEIVWFEFLQGEYLVIQGRAPHVTLLSFLLAIVCLRAPILIQSSRRWFGLLYGVTLIALLVVFVSCSDRSLVRRLITWQLA